MPTEIEIVEDRGASTPSDQGFLKVRRLRLRRRETDSPPAPHTSTGNGLGPVFAYDVAMRDALDAVLIVLWSPRPEDPADPWVLVRTALRPPLLLRRSHPLSVPDVRTGLELWELPAGLIEPDERGMDGVCNAAARETREETGYTVSPRDFTPLGVPVYLSPGLCPEKLHVMAARVDHRANVGPQCADGEVEQGARTAWWTLADGLARAAEGVIEDAKTELGLHRLRARVVAEAVADGGRRTGR